MSKGISKSSEVDIKALSIIKLYIQIDWSY